MNKSVAVCYPLGDFEVDDNAVIINGFYTELTPRPPEPPKEFAVQSLAKTGSNGALDVNLIWNSATRNQDREADGYNIYLLDKNPNEPYLHLQNTEGPVFPGSGDYTEYTVHLRNNDYGDKVTFYIAPVYMNLNTGGVLVVSEGNIGNKAVIGSVSQAIDGNVIITKQPENQRITRSETNETVSFEIEAGKNKQAPVIGPVTFTWQQFDNTVEKWIDKKTETVNISNNGIYKNVYSLTVPAGEKESYHERGVRCLVSCGNYTVHSDIVSVILDDDLRPLATVRYEGCDGAHLAFKDFESSSLINNFSCHYDAGATVKLAVDNDELFDKGVHIFGETDNDITSNVNIVYDRANSEIRFTMPDQYVYISVPSIHRYVNGICGHCGLYEAPSQNSGGCYELANAGNFFWFAALVNDEHEHAEFDERNTEACAVMTADIDLENRIFNNIGKFSQSIYSNVNDIFTGCFDGQRHTLGNFYTNGDYNQRAVFGNIEDAEICNLTVTGEIDATQSEMDSYETLLGFISMANYSNIHDITSCIDICSTSGAAKQMAGGIAASANSKVTITRCVNLGGITLGGFNSMASGIIADVWGNAEVKDCANLGAITCEEGDAAGILTCAEGSGNKIQNCFNSGVLTGDSESSASAITLSGADYCSIQNCYRLGGTAPEQIYPEEVTEKTAEEFASGEVGYLLNGGVTDGTQAWYQNIDNNAEPDQYPLPRSAHGTVYRLGSSSYFSNNPEFLLGDVNLDGVVDVRDITAIQRYISEYNDLTVKQFAAADVDNSGNVTVADATLLQMYLAEFNVVLG